MTYDYLIIGAGISGVTAARLLQLAGVSRFCVLEAAVEIGGLCRTKIVGGHVLDVGGGHFLCTKHPEVYQFVFDHLPKSDFNQFERVSRIALGGHEVDYPLETNIWQLPVAICAEYLISVARNGEARGQPAPQNYEDWIRWKLGDRIADDYLLPYNRKIWGVPASALDLDWLHKIPRLDVSQIAEACLTRAADRRQMPSHAGFFYPKAGGFQRLFDAIAEPVRGHIETGCPVVTIERSGATFLVNHRYRARAIINTAPWHSFGDSPIFPRDVKRAIGCLQHNQLVVSLHEAPYQTNAHWLYEPAESIPHHRTFFIHNFAPHSPANGLYHETHRNRWRSGQGELHAEFNAHAYPIPSLGWAAAIDRVLRHCEPLGLHGLGRWGQWQYFNSDVCIREAMDLVRRLGRQGWRAAA